MKATKYALAIARDSRDEVLAAIKKSDPKAQADPEGNPVRMWVTTTLTAGELMGIPGVEDVVESMGQGGSVKVKGWSEGEILQEAVEILKDVTTVADSANNEADVLMDLKNSFLALDKQFATEDGAEPVEGFDGFSDPVAKLLIKVIESHNSITSIMDSALDKMSSFYDKIAEFIEGEKKGGAVKISERIANINRYLAADEEPETEELKKEEEPEEKEKPEKPKKKEPAEEEEAPEEEAKDFSIEDDEDALDVLEQAQGMALELLEGIVNFTIEQDGNPPAWVKDKAIWEKAKEAVEPYKENYDNPIAVSVAVYKSMGGGIKKK